MAALESTSVQAVLETPSELDAPGAEEGAVNPLSVEDNRWDAHFTPMYALHEEFVRDDTENCLLANVVTRRSSCKGDRGADHPIADEAAEETTLIEADIMERTLRFLFGDPAGVKATGPSGSATRATLGLIVNCFAVRNALWPSRRAEIKALLDDEQGRFDKEELLAHNKA
uniref:Uncharacterized protein n=1 Tax=Haptolina ericina TaxID=156174 RepID=A0A7S3AJL3_9EUKA|mmetsp:Transcript_20638/g.46132  ORF Transcript_20638/g.46132 Transcript_20638/m.46132 type:complete len:171 (+) Transcript_20638:28-540(+)